MTRPVVFAFVLALLLIGAFPVAKADDAKPMPKDLTSKSVFGPDKFWEVLLTIPAKEYEAMQPIGGFGSGHPKKPEKEDPPRALHRNNFGADLPWAKGTVSVDGQTFEDIETYGLERWLGELQQELKDKSYTPSALHRAWIPKPDGKQRPLGVPTIKDRVAQTAAALVLEPIFETDLMPEQYAYRPERSALDAVSHVQKLLQAGHRQVVDADLSGYFDSIPHAELLKSL